MFWINEVNDVGRIMSNVGFNCSVLQSWTHQQPGHSTQGHIRHMHRHVHRPVHVHRHVHRCLMCPCVECPGCWWVQLCRTEQVDSQPRCSSLQNDSYLTVQTKKFSSKKLWILVQKSQLDVKRFYGKNEHLMTKWWFWKMCKNDWF